MAKLMPGRVRNEGIELFEKDLITIHQVSETQLDTTVDQHHTTMVQHLLAVVPMKK